MGTKLILAIISLVAIAVIFAAFFGLRQNNPQLNYSEDYMPKAGEIPEGFES